MQIERLLSTEQSCARDENLALMEKIAKMTEEMGQLKEDHTVLQQTHARTLGEITILRKIEDAPPEETVPLVKIKHKRSGSAQEIDSRARSRTVQIQEVAIDEKDSVIAELKNTIQKQEEIIESLKQLECINEKDESVRDSNMGLGDLPPEFKQAADSYDSPLFPKRFRINSQQQEHQPQSGFNLRANLHEVNDDQHEDRHSKAMMPGLPFEYKRAYTERDHRSEYNMKASHLQQTPTKHENKAEPPHEYAEHPSMVDEMSMSAHQIETRDKRAQTTGLNMSMESSVHMHENPADEKHNQTPNFNGKFFFAHQFTDRTIGQKTKDDMDNLDSKSEKRTGMYEMGSKTARQKPSKDQLKAKAAIFTQFFKNFRKSGKKLTKQDYSRDYLDALKRKEIAAFLSHVKDPSERVFSDAISIYRSHDRKYQYILLMTCSLLLPLDKFLLVIQPGDLAVVRHLVNVTNIEEVVLPENSQVQVVLKIKDNNDLMIECFRRFEMVRFLNQVFDYFKKGRFKVTRATEYHLLTSGFS